MKALYQKIKISKKKHTKYLLLSKNNLSSKLDQSNVNNDIFLKMQTNAELNSTSSNFTKHICLTEQNDQMKVKKLSFWEKENLSLNDIRETELYNSLLEYYKKSNKINEMKTLKEFHTNMENRTKKQNLVKEAELCNITINTTNKILLNFYKESQKEQGSILQNSITKTKSRFNFSLFQSKQQMDIQNELDLNSSTLNSIQTENFNIEFYRKVLKQKIKQEKISREELISITLRVFNKRMERLNLEEKLNELYIHRNEMSSKFYDIKNNLNERKIFTQQKVDQIKRSFSFKKVDKFSQFQKLNAMLVDCQNYDNELLKYSKEYEQFTNKFNIERDDILTEIKIKKDEERYFKIISNEITKDQQFYYLDILKKGYDVRTEGLVWVVKHLIEMQTNLEYYHFPKFLTHDQCDYLIKMADMSLEESQLKIVLLAVKNKQKILKENNERFNKMADYAKERNMNNLAEVKENEKIFKGNCSKEKEEGIQTRLLRIFTEIHQKYKSVFKSNEERLTDELKVRYIQNEIRNVIKERGMFASKKNNENLEKILSFFQKDTNSQDFLEIILNIRARLDFLEKEIFRLKEEQISIFKENKAYNNRFINAKSSLLYDLMFSALFGSNIQL